MPVRGEYLGMMLTIDDLDGENRAFFDYCAKGEFRLQRGATSGLLRYPPTTACPWSGEREYDWVRSRAEALCIPTARCITRSSPRSRTKCRT